MLSKFAKKTTNKQIFKKRWGTRVLRVLSKITKKRWGTHVLRVLSKIAKNGNSSSSSSSNPCNI